MISIVIPVLEDAGELAPTLAALATLADSPKTPSSAVEVVVVDGGSHDGSRDIAVSAGARVVTGARGRGAQMNLGAQLARGDVLWFLHADTRVGRVHLEALERVLLDPRIVSGSFPIKLDADGLFYRIVERAANLRTRLDKTPYGDQAIFCRRSAFRSVGGFLEVSILEDVLLGRDLRRTGGHVFPAGPPVVTSARRWREQGRLRTCFANASTRALFEAGVSPERLHPWYLRLTGPGARGKPGSRAGEV